MCFFFCKHKTAYEMRNSDWSSDVCSSDLYRVGNMNESIAGVRRPGVGIPIVPIPMPAVVRMGVNERKPARIEVRDDRGVRISCISVPIVGDNIAKRSEERRVGKEGVSQCRSGWSQSN